MNHVREGENDEMGIPNSSDRSRLNKSVIRILTQYKWNGANLEEMEEISSKKISTPFFWILLYSAEAATRGVL